MQAPPDHATPTPAAPAQPFALTGMRESFDLSPVPMVLLGGDGTVMRANYRVAALLGAAPDELVGRHWTAFAAPRDRESADRALQALLTGDRAILDSPEFTFDRADGQAAWFRASTSAIEQPGHDQPLLLVQLTDLGEEHRARAEVAGMLERHDRVAAVVSSSRNAIMATDLAGIVTTWNAAMEDLLGWKTVDVMGRPLASLFPGGGQQTNDLIEETLAGREIPRFATFFPRADGEHIAVDCDASPVRDAAGTAIGFSCMLVPHDPEAPDARLRWLATQQRLLSRMRTLINRGGAREAVEEGILTAVASTTFSTHVLVTDLRDDHETLRLRTAMGWAPGSLPAVDLIDDQTLMGQAVRSGQTIAIEDWDASEFQLVEALAKTGVRAGLVVPVVAGGAVVGAIGAYRPQVGPWDPSELEFVTEVASTYGDAIARWEADAERRRLDLHDRLTGLPSLTLLVDRLEQALDRDRKLGLETGLLVLDIDNFKYVNDTLGHDVGDRLLTAVVPRLQAVVRPGDTIARLSGDEFVIVCGELQDESEPMVIAESILDAFVEPFAAAGDEYVLSVSIGVTVATPVATAQELLSDADAATFRAKELGRNRVEVFDSTLRERVTERVRTERELRGAVDRGELSLRYQPIVDLRTGFIEGVEALVRWQHPERGLVGPGDFITIAEDSGLIVGLGEWVLRTATEQAAQWLRAFDLPRPFQLSVNLSARQLGDRDISATVVDALEQSGLPATSLALEVTESVLIEQEDAVDILTDLRNRGVRIMLDDFGTGYSSLSYLRRFEVDALKIDRSFVSELGERRQDALLVSALVQMANALNIDAVAEGVETAQQAQMLRVLGCGLAQGFHFARPLTIEDATELMRRGGTVPGGRAR